MQHFTNHTTKFIPLYSLKNSALHDTLTLIKRSKDYQLKYSINYFSKMALHFSKFYNLMYSIFCKSLVLGPWQSEQIIMALYVNVGTVIVVLLTGAVPNNIKSTLLMDVQHNKLYNLSYFLRGQYLQFYFIVFSSLKT